MASTLFTDGVTLTAAAWFNDVDTATYASLSAVAGTNTITATGPTSMSAYVSGQRFFFIPANTNTGATTLNVTSIGAKNVFCGGAACLGGELRIGVPALVMYDGTQFNLIGAGGKSFGLGNSTSALAPAGLVSVNVTSVGSAGAGPDDLMSYTVPANALSANFKTIRITATGLTANNANAKSLLFKFGATSVQTGLTVSSLGSWSATWLITRTGSGTQFMRVILHESPATSPLSTGKTWISGTTPNETDTASITVKFQANGVAANDVTQTSMFVEFMN